MRLWLLRIFVLGVLGVIAVALVRGAGWMDDLGRQALFERAAQDAGPPTDGSVPSSPARSAREKAPARPDDPAAREVSRALDGIMDGLQVEPAEASMVVPMPPASLPIGRDMRLEGERATRTARVFLTEGQIAPARLSLGYTASIFVMPERSTLTASVNGIEVGRVQIESGRGIVRQAFDVPGEAFKPGWNEIEIAARQFHRTDCSLESMFDIWTQIQPAATFLEFPDREAIVREARDLRALSAGADGRFDVAVHAPGLRHVDVAERFLLVAQHLALLVDTDGIRFKVADRRPAANDADLLLLMGDPAAMSAGIAPRATEALGTTTVLESGASAGYPTLGVLGATPEEMADALAQLGRLWQALDAQHGRRQDIFGPQRIEGRTEMRFSDLGVGYRETDARRDTTRLRLELPDDFYAANYGEAMMRLDAAYTPDIAQGSQIMIFINGEMTRSIPLAPRGSGRLRDARIGLPMKHFAPGENEIEIVSEIVTEADMACQPGQPADSGTRFAIAETSRLAVPNFARTRQVPDLRAFRVGAGRDGSVEPMDVVVPRANGEIYAATATLMARLALADHGPVGVALRGRVAEGGDRTSLLIASAPGVPRDIASAAGLAPDALTAWRHRPETNEPTAARAEGGLRGQAARGGFGGLTMADMAPWASHSDAVAPGNGHAAALAEASAGINDGRLVVVTAPDDVALAAGIEALAAPEAWRSVEGQVALVDATSGVVSTHRAGFVRFEGLDWRAPANARLVLANWVSSGGAFYALVAIVAALILGLATSAVLARSGRGVTKRQGE